RNRFRRSWETTVRLEVDAGDLAAKPLEQRAHWRAARPAHRVERDRELPLPNPLDIDRRQPEYGVEVPLDGARIRRHASRIPHPGSRGFGGQLRHAVPIRPVEKDPVRPDEL